MQEPSLRAQRSALNPFNPSNETSILTNGPLRVQRSAIASLQLQTNSNHHNHQLPTTTDRPSLAQKGRIGLSCTNTRPSSRRPVMSSPLHPCPRHKRSGKDHVVQVPGRPRQGFSWFAPSASSTDVTKADRCSVPTSPFPVKPADGPQSIIQFESGTPFSPNVKQEQRILATASWSDTAEDDLVSNLGARSTLARKFRLRSLPAKNVQVRPQFSPLPFFDSSISRRRYVQELTKMRDTFIDPLPHTFASSTHVPSHARLR